ncbi:unnamed protein product [Oikopleura dioica]|uniref:Uncharacterized protein n=1 Tax=Oikopleura dioica TaxID=34765 RepID=E4Y0G8_OIKDI|nr:unnamed protein product [Oikopleura dioica]
MYDEKMENSIICLEELARRKLPSYNDNQSFIISGTFPKATFYPDYCVGAFLASKDTALKLLETVQILTEKGEEIKICSSKMPRRSFGGRKLEKIGDLEIYKNYKMKFQRRMVRESEKIDFLQDATYIYANISAFQDLCLNFTGSADLQFCSENISMVFQNRKRRQEIRVYINPSEYEKMKEDLEALNLEEKQKLVKDAQIEEAMQKLRDEIVERILKNEELKTKYKSTRADLHKTEFSQIRAAESEFEAVSSHQRALTDLDKNESVIVELQRAFDSSKASKAISKS